MPVQFGLGVINSIPETYAYKKQNVKQAVDTLVAPLQNVFPQNTITLHVSLKPQNFESYALLGHAWEALKLSNPLSQTAPESRRVQAKFAG
jgi:hypothetical protein